MFSTSGIKTRLTLKIWTLGFWASLTSLGLRRFRSLVGGTQEVVEGAKLGVAARVPSKNTDEGSDESNDGAALSQGLQVIQCPITEHRFPAIDGCLRINKEGLPRAGLTVLLCCLIVLDDLVV